MQGLRLRLDQPVNQRLDFLYPLAERRDMERNGIKPVVQIRAKLVLPDSVSRSILVAAISRKLTSRGRLSPTRSKHRS